jgi:hypothetical protein
LAGGGSWATTAASSGSIVSLAWQQGHSTVMDLGMAGMGVTLASALKGVKFR